MIYFVKLLKRFRNDFRLHKIQNNFIKKNKHNNVRVLSGNPSTNISVGNYSYGGINYLDYYVGCFLKIGNFCSIARNNFFCMGGEHDFKCFSSFPFEQQINKKNCSHAKGDIVIDDDVWIGVNCIILSGVHIGQGAIIGAGSVVTGNVEPYSIYGGAPAKLIKKRFSDNVIQKMMKIDFSKLDFDKYEKYKNLLSSEIDEKNVDEIVNVINS
ncbi:MAG: CatB-related O-acetyltransferase [Acholeplasmatales bacterium]|nr:CatB-related O-acetyltransferase [Acholeplasmatales bacterium]